MNTTQREELDLSDIQGNVVRGYARLALPKGRYICYQVHEERAGRAFLRHLLPHVTSGALRSIASENRGKERISVTTDVAISYAGLRALGVPEASLRSFPEEFALGMKSRRSILGDDGPSAPEHWDPIWQAAESVHLLIMLNGATVGHLDERFALINSLVSDSKGAVTIRGGHRGDGGRDDLPYQEASALFENGVPTPKEHFGFVDGISNPFFRGCGAHPSNVIGGGKLVRRGFGAELSWEPLEAGEFLLGHKDETGEPAPAPTPNVLSMNGTFMVYRKLHEDVAAFEQYMRAMDRRFPGGRELLTAKFAGRWRNGAPISKFPTKAAADALAEQWTQAKRDIEESTTPEARQAAKERFSVLNRQMVDFHYNDDIDGLHCPGGAHVRRVNPRAALEFGETLAFETPSALSNRRRILRRGLPYGSSDKDGGNHGVIFLGINASIARQFEFVQQQWINYGNDFRLANEKDAIAGNHGRDASGRPDGRVIVPAGSGRESAPHFCSRIPRFVETRGGEYFFVPSMTALRMIAEGTIDPT